MQPPAVEGVRGTRRHLATAVCAWVGHVTPAAAVRDLSGPLLLGVEMGGTGGEPPWRLVCCTRCDGWVAVEVPAPATAEVLPGPADLVLPRRGRDLRQALTIRVIAVWRSLHALLFALVAALAVALRLELSGVQSWVRDLLQRLTRTNNGTAGALNSSFVVREGRHLVALRPTTLDLLIGVAVLYTVVAATEAVGLWRERRWAEYLTVLETAGLIPYEVYELAKAVTVFKVAALVVNVVVLVYLVWTKGLFGVERWRRDRRPPRPDPMVLFGRPPPLQPGAPSPA